mgnify:CR=1 FL=1
MFYKPFKDATKVIGVSPVKDHNLCKATVTMKNWYGLLGNPRNQFHQNIHGIITDGGQAVNVIPHHTAASLLLRAEDDAYLDDVLKGYATVLDRDPGNRDAAYNYEFVARLRGALAGGRTSGAAEPEARSIQGEQGEPPQGTRKSDFNVIVPLRPEERQEQLDPGGGAEFKRKG